MFGSFAPRTERGVGAGAPRKESISAAELTLQNTLRLKNHSAGLGIPEKPRTDSASDRLFAGLWSFQVNRYTADS